MAEYYQLSANEAMQKLRTNERGISEREAEKRLKEFGKNIIEKKEKFLGLKVFVSQFKSSLILILIIAAGISFLLKESIDGYAIIAILVLNVGLGFYQEYSAESAIALLKKMAISKANVIRAGRQIEIPSEELVLGDIVLLEPGDKVSADIRIIESKGLMVDESMLTGESFPVSKNPKVIDIFTQMQDRKNMLYSGTLVVSGRCRGVAVATGMGTEFGKIAEMIEIPEVWTPLHRKLETLGRNLGLIAIAICLLIVAVGMLRSIEFMEILFTGIALAVAAIPEGLPAVVTVCLALGTQRMLRRNALVRKLHAVETLGSVTVICADKTGTITRNEMTVTELWMRGARITVTGKGYETKGKFSVNRKEIDPRKDPELRLALEIGASCNNASLPGIGDPTEIALLVVAEKGGIKKIGGVDEIQFTSERKWMATSHMVQGRPRIYVKGACERVLKKCGRIIENGRIRKLGERERKVILQENEKMGSKALRVLALAYSEGKIRGEDVDNLVFVGLAGMIDPARSEIKDAISLCKKAGIRVIMITGDYKATALAVAKQIGIHGTAVEGAELNRLDDDKTRRLVNEVNIFTRVDPTHKVKILNALKAQGDIVAMTGDGINDAPALKSADVGIAMGIKGTDVSREASDIVLRDDNFASIVAAVKEGRVVYDNIQKFVRYLVAANIGEIGIIGVAMAVGMSLPLLPLQILWINLITDGLPALALSVEPAEEVMKRKPRNPKEGILHGSWRRILISGVVLVLATLIGFTMYKDMDIEKGRTVAFSVVVLFELFLVFGIKSERSVLKTWATNKWLIAAVIASGILQITVLYTGLSGIFGAVPLNLNELAIVLALSLTGIITFEIMKAYGSKRRY